MTASTSLIDLRDSFLGVFAEIRPPTSCSLPRKLEEMGQNRLAPTCSLELAYTRRVLRCCKKG